jgi:DNA polymerase (family 10)
MERLAIAKALRDIGTLLELRGDPPFRAQAYAKGATALEATNDFDRLLAEKRLTSLPGVGQGLAAAIDELARSGSCKVLDELRAELPPGALELAAVLTLDRMRRLHAALGIDSLDALEAACAAGKVRDVSGFGVATEAKLLDKIRSHRSRGAELLLSDALVLAESLAEHVRGALPWLDDVVIVGQVRRRLEVIDTVHLLAVGSGPWSPSQPGLPTEVVEGLARYPRVASVVPHPSDRSAEARLVDGTRVVLGLVEPDALGPALVRLTGPSEHADDLLSRPLPPGASEATIYEAASMAFVPPELRDDGSTLARAKRGVLAPLVTAADIQGFVHCHTTWSDGRGSIAEMAAAAASLGVRYLTITDHSGTASYANGLDIDRIRAQWDEIDRVQATTSVRLLKGVESDILADGALDYPDEILRGMDLVIASIHERHAQSEEAMTQRVLAAMRHPIRKIWGHPLGRLLLKRPAIACRIDEILHAAAETGTILELNGDPHRMDLPPEIARKAKALGISFVCSVDAHAPGHFAYLDGAVTLARRAGLAPEDILNTRSVEDFRAAVTPMRA